ncbi:YggS family pyridoxal phosphate-dependent enzyme [Homoserinibacter sp. YIM 151385]|uniref:YggS family pyridoxal phosphate-dependent enzyme n=1 Tax=Homoserinibacter sp. YIM 151385 TaxID=2985506 RepID=UPI0022F00BD8|nr:YggS family pyridoxal phosphate-dependent enzyme [Homoserinibacter sp. YIM 151385]WBU38735.1 YggS family pyridoxal phosphate-dependent enzyme [Homoserinibacter sp. YIM 151385]
MSEPGLAERLASVDAGIAEAARLAGRDPAEVTRIVVTKFHPASLVRELAALGVHEVGENRHQEAQAKARELEDLDLEWHFVGQLQSKKARQVREYAAVLHSLDRDSVVDALAGGEPIVDGFVQLNLTDDPGRGGTGDADALLRIAERVLTGGGIRLLGVMAVAPLDVEPARAFAEVRRQSERLRELAPEADRISAGMSHDYREAVAAGATHLRIGTAITGKRPERG